MRITVRDNLGKDVTNDREWYINTDGKIFYYTGDIDGPLYIVDNDYTWETDIPTMDKYMFFTTDIAIENDCKAHSDRIAEAVESTKKYVR